MKKKDGPIRVLQVVNKMDRAGLETMLMNYYRNIDKERVQFDFLTHREEKGEYDDEIIKLGGRIYHAPRLMPQNYHRYFKFMKKFFCDHPEYKIVHSHIDTMSAFSLLAAKRSNVAVRIAHSHSSKLDKDYKLPIKYLAKQIVPFVANEYYACGEIAGKFLFKNRKFKVVNNAININDFKFNNDCRTIVREELNIKEDVLVIGHVGRYIYIKNQIFLINLTKELLDRNVKIVLILVGIGDDEKKLRKRVSELGIEKNVIFLINRDDVNKIYQAMDLFVMPSLFEGIPLVAIEAQVNGLPCIVSKTISKEILLTDNIEMEDIYGDISKWVDRIENVKKVRNNNIERLRNCGYDIKIESKKLENNYVEYYEEWCSDENSNDRS